MRYANNKSIVTMNRTLLVVFFALFSIGILRADVAEDVTFRFFNINNKYYPHYLGFDSKNLTESGFDPSKQTKIITHGFLNNGSGVSCIAVRDAFLRHHDYNVIIVDYERIAMNIISLPNNKIRKVGEYMAKFIDFLIENGNSPSNIHLLGHSLGGHVVGHAARKVTRGKVARVSGLDPALMGENEYRLSPDVAEFVDVIHTCGGIFGMVASVGTVDFYPNGGVAVQPNCGILGVICSHYEAVWFMAKSIDDPKKYPARLCGSNSDFKNGKCNNNEIAYMGIEAALPSHGDYYLATSRDN